MLETQDMQIRSLGQEDPLEEEMATHSSILAWRITWTEEPRGIYSVGSQLFGHNSLDTTERLSRLAYRVLKIIGLQQLSVPENFLRVLPRSR